MFKNKLYLISNFFFITFNKLFSTQNIQNKQNNEMCPFVKMNNSTIEISNKTLLE